jgi:hypothetical protein
MDQSFEAIRVKYREAEFHLRRLASLGAMEEFYATVNAFMTAARSVLYVARYQFGLEERLASQKAGLSPEETVDRRAFDSWYSLSQLVQTILNHPLTEERREVVHRSGQAGFIHVAKPLMGLAVSEGSPFKPSPFRTKRGMMPFPILDQNAFFHVDAAGNRVDAVPFCENYLSLLRQFLIEAERAPWR